MSRMIDILPRLDSVSESSPDNIFSRLKRIESILRNGLPTEDKAEASAIAHAHSEIELLLESIDEDWWMR